MMICVETEQDYQAVSAGAVLTAWKGRSTENADFQWTIRE
jgi:hypothetical protein